VLVSYSGGVDSALLLKLAHQELGDQALAAYITSPIMVPHERERAIEVAALIGAPLRIVQGIEMENPVFCANDPLRCYYCHVSNYEPLREVAEDEDLAAIVDGANVDDTGDYRPGRRAATEKGIRSPLLEAGLSKAEIRAISRELGLPTWNKPSMPCLASRIPYGTEVTRPALRRIEAAENALRELGFVELRVRHHDDVARIEVPPGDFERVLEQRQEIVKRLQEAGYLYVTLDLAGFRSGSLNEAIDTEKEEI
jgi:uncharacterized protein